MQNRRGRKKKHPAMILQVTWWAYQVRKHWRGSEKELIQAVWRRWRSLAPREDFLYDALHSGSEPQMRRGQRRFLEYVNAIASLPGMDLTGTDPRRPLFRLGDAESFTLEGITKMLADLLRPMKCGRLSSKETLACEILRKEWLSLSYRLPDIPFEQRAEDWSVESLINARAFMPRFDWVALIVLCFREALLCSNPKFARNIKERSSDFIYADIDRAFARLPKYAQKCAVMRFKRSIFDKKFPLPSETFEEHLAKAKILPRALLTNYELRLRRRALATRSRDRFAAYALMKNDQTLWIHGRADP